MTIERPSAGLSRRSEITDSKLPIEGQRGCASSVPVGRIQTVSDSPKSSLGRKGDFAVQALLKSYVAVAQA